VSAPRLSTFTLAREVLRNVTASPVRTALTALAAAVVGASVVLATVANVDDIVQAHETQELRGLSTLSITGVNGEAVSAGECDATNTLDAVSAAGSVLRVEQIHPANTDTPVSVRYTTPGYIAVAYPGTKRDVESIAGGDLVAEIGAVSGGTISDATRGAQTVGITIEVAATSRSRIEGINRDLVVAVAPLGATSECLVEVSDGLTNEVAAAMPAFFSTPISVRPFLPADRVDRDPARELDTRWSQVVWVGGGVGVALFAAFAWWSRRHETALYRLLGFTKRSIAILVGLETVLVSLVPAQLAIAWAMGLVPIDGGTVTLTALTADTARLSFLLLLAPTAAIIASLSGSAVDRLKGQ
jgi:hypothetical protein